MITIYKYPLKEGYDHTYTAEVPRVHKIVHFGKDGFDELCIWCEVHREDEPDRELKFKLFGTGWDLTSDGGLEHIKTIVEKSGLVWHYYQIA